MKSPIFTLSDGGKLEISSHALSRMLAFVQDTRRKPEAGGVLIGRYIRDSRDIVIDEVTVPMVGDRSLRFNFWRARKRHQQALDQAWLLSGGTSTYLGEWHTHPEDIPEPSDTDIKNWQSRLKQDIFSSDTLFFIIIGIANLRIWSGCRFNLSFQLIGEFQHIGDQNIKTKNST
jgi:integrative and conjugative element protein (TIGR02256 family)